MDESPRKRISKQVAERLNLDVTDLAVLMIFRGMFPSQGWRIAVLWDESPGCTIGYSLIPVSPGGVLTALPK